MRGTCVEKLVESWYHILVSIFMYYYLPKVKVCLGMPSRHVGGSEGLALLILKLGTGCQ